MASVKSSALRISNLIMVLALTNMSPNANGQSYTVEPLNISLATVKDIQFISEDTGYVVLTYGFSGELIRTFDSGTNWSAVASPEHFRTIQMLDSQNGYALASGEGVFHTTDGGSNWALADSTPYKDITYFNDTIAYAQIGLELLRSTDTGNTWSGIFQRGYPFNFFFRDGLNGYVGESTIPTGDSIWATSDGGQSWAGIGVPGMTRGPSQIFHTSADTAYLVEWENGLYKSIDGGMTWFALNTDPSWYLRDAWFISNDVGFAVGNSPFGSIIIQTNDGGNNWDLLYTHIGVGNVNTQVFFPNAQVGYAGGNMGQMFRIAVEGVSIEEVSPYPLVQVSPNPSSGTMIIQAEPSVREIIIHDLAGSVVHQELITSQNRNELVLQEAGVYFIMAIGEGQRSTTKFVVTH